MGSRLTSLPNLYRYRLLPSLSTRRPRGDVLENESNDEKRPSRSGRVADGGCAYGVLGSGRAAGGLQCASGRRKHGQLAARKVEPGDLLGVVQRKPDTAPSAAQADAWADSDRGTRPALGVVDEKSIRRLIIIPSLSLATLPFEALVVGSRTKAPASFDDLEFVLDRFEVAYGPSSPVLVELSDIGPRAAHGRVLVLADPVYAGEAPLETEAKEPIAKSILGIQRSVPDPLRLERLEKTRDEALAIARLLIEPDDSKAAVALLAFLTPLDIGSRARLSVSIRMDCPPLTTKERHRCHRTPMP